MAAPNSVSTLQARTGFSRDTTEGAVVRTGGEKESCENEAGWTLLSPV